MKQRVYIWGLGKGLPKVIENIDYEKVDLIGLVDSDKNRTNQIINGCRVIQPESLDYTVDYIIIASMFAYKEIKEQLIEMGVSILNVICYFDPYEKNIDKCECFSSLMRREMEIVDFYASRRYEEMKMQLDNMEYEIADRIRNNTYVFPKIKEREEVLLRAKREKMSVCRYGDGEFEIMLDRKRAEFQNPDLELAIRLKEILLNSSSRVLTCIANNYGSLDLFTDEAAKEIRRYLSPTVRKEHMSLIDLDKDYYDAYVSRPYILYKDKQDAEKIFNLWKQLWENREVVLVEGELSRNGVGNDLFDNVKSIERILCPAENAWDMYDEIIRTVKGYADKDKLILVALGPTATVLAYDLSEEGYQAIDMGHLDNEYEWYNKGVKERVNIEHKYVHECGIDGRKVDSIKDMQYESQIVVRIK